MKITDAVVLCFMFLPQIDNYSKGINFATLEAHYAQNKREKLVGHFRIFPVQSELRSIDSYLGIPYASLGNGKLRFMPPSYSRKWRHRKSHLKKGHGCVQMELDWIQYVRDVPKDVAQRIYAIISEIPVRSTECLNLNVHVSKRGNNILFL